MKERRREPRAPRRVHLVFWDRDEPDDRRTGFTSDTSISGVFVQTHRPFRSGTRIQLEFDRSPGSFLAEGLVVRSVTVPPDLRKLKPGGMGVRLLGIDALLRELRARDLRTTKPTPSSSEEDDTDDTEEPQGEDDAAAAQTPQKPQRRTVFERETGSRAAHLHPAFAKARSSEPQPGRRAESDPPEQRPQPFAIAFRTFEDLRQAYRDELEMGGLFVPTDSPAPVGAEVTVSLLLPLGRGTIEVAARVVQVLERGPAATPGMGIVVEDADGLAADLRRVLEEE